MKLIFFDESKNAPDYPHYHLGAICLDESALIGVEGAVQAIAIEVFGSAELSSGTEFHASEIFHRKKNFKEWHDFGRRVALLSRLVDVLSRECVQLIDIQINCRLLNAPISPLAERLRIWWIQFTSLNHISAAFFSLLMYMFGCCSFVIEIKPPRTRDIRQFSRF